MMVLVGLAVQGLRLKRLTKCDEGLLGKKELYICFLISCSVLCF